MKAGTMVKVGSGEYSVGTPEESNPIQAGTSKQHPAAITRRREFMSLTILVEHYLSGQSTDQGGKTPIPRITPLTNP
jgi:hypothetical protein